MALDYDQARTRMEKEVDAFITARVLRGIEVLNKFDPDWPDYIDPSELLLDSPTQCVLGQVFDNHRLTDEQAERFNTGADNIASTTWLPGFTKGKIILNGDVEKAPWRFGFDTDGEGYTALTEAWLVALGVDGEDD